MSEFPGIFRKGPGRGHVYRFREFDHARGKVVHRTSIEYSSARKAASARSIHLKDIEQANTASRRPTREGITIDGAWQKHPSTIREPDERRKKYARMLKAFTDHAGYVELRKLTFDDVSDWVAHLMDTKGFAWSTRFHYLLPLRRAARMAVTLGLPDVLAEMQIDERDEEEHDVQAWTLDELAKAWHYLADNPRARVALAMGAFLGLRPSETFRLRCGDVRKDGRISIGLRLDPGEALRPVKNKPSRRLLPMPEVILAEVRALIELRPPDAPLIATAKGKASGPFNDITFAEWLGPLLEKATGRDLSPKHLRKSFASWTIAAGIDFWQVEAYMGRETPLTKSITGRHYLAEFYDVVSKQLDPTAIRMDELIRTSLQNAKKTQREAKNGEHFGEHDCLGNARGTISVSQRPLKQRRNATK